MPIIFLNPKDLFFAQISALQPAETNPALVNEAVQCRDRAFDRAGGVTTVAAKAAVILLLDPCVLKVIEILNHRFDVRMIVVSDAAFPEQFKSQMRCEFLPADECQALKASVLNDTALDQAVVVSCDEGDKAEGIPFVKVDLSLSREVSLSALCQSEAYLNLIVQQYLHVVPPLELLAALHDNRLFRVARGSEELAYLLQLIDRPALWEACARQVLEKETILSYVRSIILQVKAIDSRKVTSLLLEQIQQVTISWLKDSGVFEVMNISNSAEQYSQALLLLVAALKGENILLKHLSIQDKTRCDRFADRLRYVALSESSVLSQTVMPLGDRAQDLEMNNLLASVFVVAQVQQMVSAPSSDPMPPEFRFNSAHGFKVFLEKLELSETMFLEFSSRFRMIDTRVQKPVLRPVCFDPSFTQFNPSSHALDVFAVAVERDDNVYAVYTYQRSRQGSNEGSDFYEGPNLGVEPVPLTVVADFSGGFLRITSPSNCSLIYTGVNSQVRNFPFLHFLDKVKMAVVEDPFLSTDFVLPLISSIAHWGGVERRTLLAIFSQLQRQCLEYNAALDEMSRTLSGANKKKFEDHGAFLGAALRNCLNESVVRRTVYGDLVNTADQQRNFYAFIVTLGAIIFSEVYVRVREDSFLVDVTTPELVAIDLKIQGALLALGVLTGGGLLFIAGSCLSDVWSLLKKSWFVCFGREMELRLNKLQDIIAQRHTDPRLITRLAAIISELPFAVANIVVTTHPYEISSIFLSELEIGRKGALQRYLVSLLSSNTGLRRPVSDGELRVRLFCRAALNGLVPATLAGLAVSAIFPMYHTIYSDPVQKSSTDFLTFVAIMAAVLEAPGAPVAPLMSVLFFLAYYLFDLDFLILQMEALCRALKGLPGAVCALPSAVAWAAGELRHAGAVMGRGVTGCIGRCRSGFFQDSVERTPLLPTDARVNVDDRDDAVEVEARRRQFCAIQ